MDGNKTLTLALIWQLMRAYTLSLLSQVTILSSFSVTQMISLSSAEHRWHSYRRE